MSNWMSTAITRLSSLTRRLTDHLDLGRRLRRPPPQDSWENAPDDDPNAAPLKGRSEELLARFSTHREGVVEILAQTSDLTESRIIQVGECVAAIVQETQGYVDQVGRTLSTFDSQESTGGVAGAVKDQGDTIAAYIEGLMEDCREQEATTQAAIQLCERISQAAARVNRLTGASKLLSLNTSIHANRLGGDGQALGVIAHEMQSTSERVRDINDRISTTAEDLVRTIRATVSKSDDLRGLAQNLRDEIDGLSQEIRAGSAAVEARVRDASNLSEASLGQLLQASMEALSHLQFQDPMIQNLQQLDSLMAISQTAAAGHLGVDATFEPVRFQTNLGLHLDTASQDPPEDVPDMLFF